MYKKTLLLLLVVAAMYAVWQLQQLLQKKLNPRKSLPRFLLFLLLNSIAILLIIIIAGIAIIQFKDFFFTP